MLSLPPRITRAAKAVVISFVSLGILVVILGLSVGPPDGMLWILFGLTIASVASAWYAPMALVHPYYTWSMSEHWSQIQEQKKRRLRLEAATRNLTRTHPVDWAVREMTDLMPRVDRTLPRGTVVVASYSDEILGMESRDDSGDDKGIDEFYLNPSSCASAKVVLGALTLPVTVESTDYMLGPMIRMNPDDLVELGIGRRDRILGRTKLVLELYFGDATPSMMHEMRKVWHDRGEMIRRIANSQEETEFYAEDRMAQYLKRREKGA